MSDLLHASKSALDYIFKPRSVAVVGASEKPGVGKTFLFNLIRSPFGGVIYPVNPKRRSVHGIRAYPSITEIPDEVDLAVVIIPAKYVPAVVKECADKGVKGCIVISAGFKEVGPEGEALEEEIMRVKGDTLRVIGPNCLGLMSPNIGLNATFAADIALPGKIAFLSQSGAMCTSVLDWSLQQNMGFSSFVSVGSMLDVNWGDLVSYYGNDADTEAIVIYMEAIGNAHDFFAAARQVSLVKPIIVIKAGATSAGAAAAASHTGSLTGSDSVVDAAFARCGVLRVKNMSDVFGLASLMAKQNLPKGPALSIITNAGGPGVLSVDALATGGGVVAPVSADTMERLNQTMPAAWSHGNPIDILGDAPPKRYADALRICSMDESSDATLVILTPQDMSDPTETARALVEFARGGEKPVLASWMGGLQIEEGRNILAEAGIPTFAFPDEACAVFNHMHRYHQNLLNLYESSYVSTRDGHYRKEEARAILDGAIRDGRTILSEHESKQLLHTYGIPVSLSFLAHTADEAVEAANKVGYPCVLKIHSEIITHKSDVGGVQLNLLNGEAVRQAFDLIKENVEKVRSHYQNKPLEELFLGVSVQPMIKLDGYEIIVGMNVDPQFGPMILFGTGGTLVEVYRDSAIELPPLSRNLAHRLMSRTKIFHALQGVRGKPSIDFEVLENLLVDFAQLVVDFPRISEIDINPLIASHENIVAVDARVLLHDLSMPDEELPRCVATGYPAEMQGTHGDFIVRPIQPTDETAVKRFHARQTSKSYEKFFADYDLTSTIVHDRLSRMCFIDYESEIAFVAEKDGELYGIGRVSARPNNNGEFSLTVDPECGRRGLGSRILDMIMDFAQKKNYNMVFGHITEEDTAGKDFLLKRGFELSGDIIAKKF